MAEVHHLVTYGTEKCIAEKIVILNPQRALLEAALCLWTSFNPCFDLSLML